MSKIIRFFQEEWRGLTALTGICAVGGFFGALPIYIWFFNGVCW